MAGQVARCRVCHRKLKDPESQHLGIGPVCRGRRERKAAPNPNQLGLPFLLELPAFLRR